LIRFVQLVAALLASFAAHANVAVVLNSRDASVTVIDAATQATIRTVDVGKEPHHLMQTPDRHSLIVANAIGNDLVFLDPRTGDVQRRVTGIDDPYQIGFSPDKQWFVANCLRLDRVDLYRVSGQGSDRQFRLVKRVALGKLPSHMIFSADSRFVFVTLQGSAEIAAIDLGTQAIAWRMKTGDFPAGIWMTPDDRHLLVGVMGSNYVDVIDWRAQKSVKRIVTGDGTHNFRPMGDGHGVFVTNRVANTISLIDQDKLEKVYDIPVPGGPDCMDLSADGTQLWVTTRWAKQVVVVDVAARKVVRQVPVGRSPHGIFLSDSAAWK
jgi:YVTN family beta-propeller protein